MSWLIEMIEPARLVELGCHTGYSYFVACQAVKRLGLPTSCYAVDSWQGDEHAGFYSEDVFEAVQIHNSTHYSAFSKLIRATFAEAAAQFVDGSIDLLHIDGRHFYEDVLEDLTTWRPKLSDNGILLLHDTNVREREFGVWKLFHELRQRHPGFEFIHGNGLGVLAFGSVPPRVACLFDNSDETAAILRMAYSTLGQAVTRQWQLSELSRKDAAHRAVIKQLQAEAAEARQQTDALKAQHAAALAAAARRAQVEAASLTDKIVERDRKLAEQLAAHDRAETQIQTQNATIERLIGAETTANEVLEAVRANFARLQHDHARLVGSMSWRVTRPLRQAFQRFPRASRSGVTIARLGWWTATFQFRRISDSLRTPETIRPQDFPQPGPMITETDSPPVAGFAVADPVDHTRIECRKRPGADKEVALFVTHSRNGRLKPHVRHYLESLRRENVAVTLIVAADQGFTDDEPWLYDLVDGLYVRENGGWDFACWAHVLRLNRALYRAEILYWLNDSLIGPVNQQAFHALLERVRAKNAGLIGLTTSEERGHHIQSFFLAFKPEALRSFAFHQFVLGVRSLSDKEDVINTYEIKLAPYLEQAGISIATLFESPSIYNPMLYHWKKLLNDGLPFLKVMAVTHDIPNVDKSGWREELSSHGYDALVADRLLAEKEDRSAAPPEMAACPHRPALPNESPQLTFIGPFNYGNGLGVAARGYMSALMHTGLPTNMLPIERPFHIHQRVSPTLPSTECVGPPDVALVHLNPEAWSALLTSAQIEQIETSRHRIGLFVWESQEVPREFVDMAGRLSAVWAPSRYCAEGFRSVFKVPVHVVPYVVPVRPRQVNPARVAQLRHDLGIDPANRVVLFSFDASSYIARKNPQALVRAFDRSGLTHSGWRLVLKTKHMSEAKADGQALMDAIDRSAGTLLLDRSLDVEAARTLLDMADIYASPHASEGFGLTIAEGMAQGKPVIASDFGGSCDFLDETSGFPVRCTPWQLQEDYGPYLRGTTWGRIDEDLLSETLANVASLSSAELAEIGMKARQRIEAQLSPRAVAGRIRASIDEVLRFDDLKVGSIA